MLRRHENKAKRPSVCIYLVKDRALGCVYSSESVRNIKRFKSFVILTLPSEGPMVLIFFLLCS